MLGKTSASRRAGLFLEHHGSSRCFTQPQGQLHIRQCSFSTGVVVVASPCGSDCALPLRQPASSACFGATPQLPSKRRIQTPPRRVVDRVVVQKLDEDDSAVRPKGEYSQSQARLPRSCSTAVALCVCAMHVSRFRCCSLLAPCRSSRAPCCAFTTSCCSVQRRSRSLPRVSARCCSFSSTEFRRMLGRLCSVLHVQFVSARCCSFILKSTISMLLKAVGICLPSSV